MTHTSRIPVADELENAFAKARTEGGIRFIKVLIDNEQLVSSGRPQPQNGTQKEDWVHLSSALEPKKPCYVLYKLDSNSEATQWVLLSWVPDGSPVKDRMMYASTRDALKKQLGLTYFADTYHGSEKSEFTYEAYSAARDKAAAPAPYTAAEVQFKNETSAEIDHGTAREYVHSVKFPLSEAAKSALSGYGSSHNMVQLSVDPVKETIELVNKKDVSSIDNLLAEIPETEPRYTFYKYDHEHEGERFESNLFIYSCPPKSQIKLKMLYSTVKSVVSAAAEETGILIEKNGKVEMTDPEDFSVSDINSNLHPVQEKVEKFARPMRPGRGKPRMTRGK